MRQAKEDSARSDLHVGVKNSFCTDWGDQGYAYLPFDYCSTRRCWRDKTLAAVRAVIKKAAPKVVEECTSRGVPVWSLAGTVWF